ncbi:hypothetical protein JOD67_006319 [Tenggerimyces flavus]|nr:hypothetical protein [Tenggerimyces flavus]
MDDGASPALDDSGSRARCLTDGRNRPSIAVEKLSDQLGGGLELLGSYGEPREDIAIWAGVNWNGSVVVAERMVAARVVIEPAGACYVTEGAEVASLLTVENGSAGESLTDDTVAEGDVDEFGDIASDGLELSTVRFGP